ncbi:hypothetical protein [Gluconobacter kondonii]|uniref:hypothetical protein n=1 Tax=Gluconobacter kondonii TaxID=941463 RepID=UPI001B8AA757|nr:hypothetical protein [Gluconobacter kondonii]MBS1056130.1 hypothetical protein [Gluconobacter kondonii]
MPVRKLLKFFDSSDRDLRISIGEIEKKVLGLLHGHQISYCPMLDEGADNPILGMLEQQDCPTGWSGEGVTNYVHFRASESPAMRRLIICKELTHILDPDCYLTNTETHVEDLIIDLAAPIGIRDANQHAAHDKRSLVLALSIFLPPSIRSILLPKFEDGTLTAEQISEDVEIPLDMVKYVMSSRWPDLYKYTLECIEEDLNVHEAAA